MRELTQVRDAVIGALTAAGLPAFAAFPAEEARRYEAAVAAGVIAGDADRVLEVISQAERVVSAGQGIGDKKNMKLVEDLAKAAGAAVGSSRPVAETLKYVPLDRYVGMSGQKFKGNLYIACGISGAIQHLKGIKDASTIVAINKNGNAPIFKNCDYGIVGDVNEILPLLTAALDTGEKAPAPPMVKMKRPAPPKPEPIGKRYVCGGCGYEYVPELGDPDAEVAPGTLFENLPEEWVCPECAEGKDMFIEA